MKSFIINENDAGQRVDRFIEKSVPLLPKGLMQKYIRLKRIKRNGKRTAPADRLMAGDELQLYINDEFFSDTKSQKLDFLQAEKLTGIIYEDENIILVNKPAGLIVHENDKIKGDTLIDRILRYLYEKKEYDPARENSFTPALCNRIDQYTQGLIIAAKNAAALRILNQKLKDREIKKFYLCLVHGKPRSSRETLHGWLTKDGASNTVEVSTKPINGAKEITTAYKVIKSGQKYSLLEIDLLTGRSHQIRAHLSSIGCPICGDSKYGADSIGKLPGMYHQALCAYKLEFAFTEDAGPLNYLNGKVFELNDIPFVNLVK
ncbi:MAG: RluA family pseudouridine synthase [Oscillospiraceae bacterium]|nr:RluA family pseudouridine synthase [Oscillospiraceae bacterium]